MPSRGREFHVPCFQIISRDALKHDAVKVLHTICQQIGKTQQWPQDWKRSVFIPIPKKGNAKDCSNYHTIALISQASKVILKILQARLQQYVNWELPDVQAVLEKAEEPEVKLPRSKARELQKNIYAFWPRQSFWLCGSQQTVENSQRDGNIRPPDLPLEKSVCRSGSNS